MHICGKYRNSMYVLAHVVAFGNQGGLRLSFMSRQSHHNRRCSYIREME